MDILNEVPEMGVQHTQFSKKNMGIAFTYYCIGILVARQMQMGQRRRMENEFHRGKAIDPHGGMDGVVLLHGVVFGVDSFYIVCVL